MAKKTFSIRKGFEYQDYFCLVQLLERIEMRNFTDQFLIESDELHFVDDFHLFDSEARPIKGCQVKFHTTQGYQDSFATFANRKTPGSRSLIEKLYQGWTELTGNGEFDADVEFVSAGTVGSDLGNAIDSDSGRFVEGFFVDTPFQDARNSWLSVLNITPDELREFLGDVVWRFSFGTIETLRHRATQCLSRLNLPSNRLAILEIMEVIAEIATTERRRMSIAEFLLRLKSSRVFTDAIESHFPELPTTRSHQRATTIRVACLDIDCLPSFVSTEIACLEEPAPLVNYGLGVTNSHFTGHFEDNRAVWAAEYSRWHTSRILQALDGLSTYEPDVLVLPRLSVDPDILLEIQAWCEVNQCHALASSTFDRDINETVDDLGNLFNARVSDPSAQPQDNGTTVVDLLVRPGRGSRATLSTITSPNDKRDKVMSSTRPAELVLRTGLVLAATISTSNSLSAFPHNTVELVLCSGGMNTDVLKNSLLARQELQGVPAAICSPSSAHGSEVCILHKDADPSGQSPHWEGFTIADIHYDRTSARWLASLSNRQLIPIVYHDQDFPNGDTGGWEDTLRGSSRSVAMVRYELTQSSSRPAFVRLNGEDPDNFFKRRLQEASDLIPATIGKIPHSLWGPLQKTLTELNERLHEYNLRAILPAAAEPRVIGSARYRPALIDRTEATGQLSRFVEGAAPHRVFVLHGPPGIGTSAILEEVRRLASGAETWIDFTCLQRSTFNEFLGLLLNHLGDNLTSPPPAAEETFQRIENRLRGLGGKVLILNDADNLPLKPTDTGNDLLRLFLRFFLERETSDPIRVIILSHRRLDTYGLAGSNLVLPYKVEQLDRPDTVKLLQELLLGSPYDATVAELGALADKIHNHPGLAEVVASLLQTTSAAELISGLHKRQEVKRYITQRLIGKDELKSHEVRFLKLASLFNIPVERSAFAGATGAMSRAIINDLNNRLLLTESFDGRIHVNELVAEHFRHDLTEAEARPLHKIAYRYFEATAKSRELDVNELGELVFHGLRSSEKLDLAALGLYLGPARRAMLKALSAREWDSLGSIAASVLSIVKEDPVATICLWLANDENKHDNSRIRLEDAIGRIDTEDLWVAVSVVKAKVRGHAFGEADRILRILETRFGQRHQLMVARAQYYERRGRVDEAAELCRSVIESDRAHRSDIQNAIRILRKAGRLKVFLESYKPFEHGRSDEIDRQFAYASVVTGAAKVSGLEKLEQLWAESPDNGEIVADFASALGAIGEDDRGEGVFKDALRRFAGERQRFPIMEEYSRFLTKRTRFREANQILKEYYSARPNVHHVARRYARSLFLEAREANIERDYGREEVCISESGRVLTDLIQDAPDDEWARHLLEVVQRRDYDANITVSYEDE